MFLPRIFRETKGYTEECRQSRVDLDARIRKAVSEWKDPGHAKGETA